MRYPNGFPGWVDLATSDPDGAKAFYTDIFGWTFDDRPTDGGPPYSMAYLGGVAPGNLVCGLGSAPPGSAETGTPPAWTTYVMVGDLDEMVTAAPGAGGTVVVPAIDVMSEGRMAVVADPSGAMIGMWQPGNHDGADVFNVPGTWGWSELQCRDLAAALPFYEEMFAWRWEKTDMGDGTDYLLAHLDTKGEGAEGVDTSVAGAMVMPATVPSDVPSGWNVYFVSDDVDAVTARVTELGGTVASEPMDVPGMRFAVVADPFGAYFHVMTAMPPQA